jgi:hypothetical protein
MREPRIRVRREIGVLRKDLIGRLHLVELDEKALVAHERMERIEHLAREHVIRKRIRVRQRRHAEIDK